MFQAMSPWFELRVGLFTETTSKNILRAVKYLLADNVEFGDAARLLFDIFGFKMQQYSTEEVMSKQKAMVKKMYKQLGHVAEKSTTMEQMVEVVALNYPHKDVVNWKNYNLWCMALIKRKSKTTIDSFWNGQMAEPKIHANIQRFLQLHVPEDMGLCI